MIPPIVIAMASGLYLLFLEGLTDRGLLLAFLLCPFYYLGAEVLVRRITVDDRGILVSKLFRSVFVRWSEVESLDAVQAGNKLFVIVQAYDRRPFFITNTIRPFVELKDRILEYVPDDRIATGTRDTLANPPTKHWPMVQAWIVCLVLTGIVVARLLGYG